MNAQPFKLYKLDVNSTQKFHNLMIFTYLSSLGNPIRVLDISNSVDFVLYVYFY